MAEFSVRIELHGAETKDYTQLHDAMEKAGFVRYIIITANQVKKALPTAEYNFISDTRDKTQVQELASEAVKQALEDNLPRIKALNNPPMIVVTKSAGRQVSGLKPFVEKK